jgi:hypothetical protein
MFSILRPLFGTLKKKSPAHEFKIARSFSEPPGGGASARAYIHAMNQYWHELSIITRTRIVIKAAQNKIQ